MERVDNVDGEIDGQRDVMKERQGSRDRDRYLSKTDRYGNSQPARPDLYLYYNTLFLDCFIYIAYDGRFFFDRPLLESADLPGLRERCRCITTHRRIWCLKS